MPTAFQIEEYFTMLRYVIVTTVILTKPACINSPRCVVELHDLLHRNVSVDATTA